MVYNCKHCNKEYKSLQSRSNHYRLYHSSKKTFHEIKPIQIIKVTNSNIKPDTYNKYVCKYCSNIYKYKQSKYKHEKTCKSKEICKKNESYSKIQSNLDIKIDYPLNNQLIDIIVDKTKMIEELKNRIENKDNTIVKTNNCQSNFIVNNITIMYRHEDNYINATQLCQAGNKNFNDWFILDTTIQLVNEYIHELGISMSELVDNKGDIWLHSELAIHLTHWISPLFYIKVIKLIKNITGGQSHKNEIKLKDDKIQLLTDSFIKKQKRKDYPGKNVIYMLTTEDNKKKRNYVVGKAINLKKRLSSYNKTSEHEVIYYKSCNSVDDMNIIETLVLNKMKKYREKANRDRFILPVGKDIVFFTNIINNCIDFINNVY